ncbi:MAG: hypothetical protein ACE5I1_03480, partial [bacterium]
MKTNIQSIVFLVLLFGSFAALSAQETGTRKKPEKAPPHVADKVDAIDMEKEMEALEYLRKISLQKAEKLQQLKTVNEREYQFQLQRVFEEMARAIRLKERNPAQYERTIKIKQMEERSRVLGRNYRDAADAERAKIESEIKAILSGLFDLREENRQEEVNRLEECLQELRES